MTTAQLEVLLGAIGILLTVGGLFFKLHSDAKKTESRLTKVETKVDQIHHILWEMIDPLLGDVLHKPHASYAQSDRLIEKFLAGELTNGDKVQLREYAKRVVATDDDKIERLAAALLLMRLEMEE